MEITTEEQAKEKRMRRIEDSLRDLWDNIKRTNIRIIGVPEEEEKKRKSPKINLGRKTINLCVKLIKDKILSSSNFEYCFVDPNCDMFYMPNDLQRKKKLY